MKNLDILLFLHLFLLSTSFCLGQRIEKQVLLQRTYDENDQIYTQCIPYDSEAEQIFEASRSNSAELLSEEIIEITTWYYTEDTLAMATVTSRHVYDEAQLDRIQRNSPSNLQRDIPWNGPLTKSNVQNAFNHGRSEEDRQLSNTPTPMSQPEGQDIELALWLSNDDRTSRGLLPFHGIEKSVQEIAQGHLDDMLNNNFFSHTGSNGKSPFRRIDDHPDIGRNAGPRGEDCHEFLPRGENLAAFWTSGNSIPLTIERSQYNFVYNDASSAWGHRECALLGEKDLNGGKGFTNNVGPANSEGMVGYAIGGSRNFNPYNFSWARYGEVLVFNMIDPVPSCTYEIISAESQPMGGINSFSAEADDKNVQLNWSAQNDAQTSLYHIELSTDDENWRTLARLSAQRSTEEIVSYSYTLHDVEPGTHYFRIAQQSDSDNFSYSTSRRLTIQGQDGGNDDGEIITAADIQVRLINSNLVIETPGTLLVTITSTLGTTENIEYNPGDQISLNRYTPGVYIIRIMSPKDKSTLMILRLFIRG